MTRAIAVIVARIIFSFIFFMAAGFKFADMGATSTYIASAGFPMAGFLAWVAAFFEMALALALITGVFFTEASLLAGTYVVFLAFAFHGPSRWTDNQAEFGFFIDHFSFLAGLLFAAVHGPEKWAIRRSLVRL
ncbi:MULTISPECIES: DoxX family protein [Rhizobium]|uniref:Membrane protein YphA (DoxX/SURF4 family) n=2 Tax=Rhizobium mongolense TaxID=57676 RepID=A0A7W6RNS3_9HYPH|nr:MULTISPECIES: DoxX family protein [Rhizobium]OWK23904.1 membrane protein [Rhizobium yanglingense]MBB4231385.1 putative membrane protein YphA (DoxX/SURF4 family) [Rhizobium mongolense]MBB4275759.1 putative membrane protein YphA (DoxX/SURF4 family) [Rhizobium mongolense]QPB19219.1 DoxX family protein [Rhizobium sp. 007]TVZ66321.1 putative membrane protein YphA (DoxX/SURF4 family) [Rhizobium mongolense USDA 1844]